MYFLEGPRNRINGTGIISMNHIHRPSIRRFASGTGRRATARDESRAEAIVTIVAGTEFALPPTLT